MFQKRANVNTFKSSGKTLWAWLEAAIGRQLRTSLVKHHEKQPGCVSHAGKKNNYKKYYAKKIFLYRVAQKKGQRSKSWYNRAALFLFFIWKGIYLSSSGVLLCFVLCVWDFFLFDFVVERECSLLFLSSHFPYPTLHKLSFIWFSSSPHRSLYLSLQEHLLVLLFVIIAICFSFCHVLRRIFLYGIVFYIPSYFVKRNILR